LSCEDEEAMVLCICRGVTDDEIVDAIRRGAFSLDKVARRCDGAGTDCGSCRAEIQAHLDSCRQQQSA
jgi:assimilatory nitrate reductase catalytic subunit